MRCNRCQVEVNVLDDFCPSCGHSLSILNDRSSALSYAVAGEPVSAMFEVELERELGRELRGETSTSSAAVQPDQVSCRLGLLQPPKGEPRFFAASLFGHDTSFEEVSQIGQFVFHSPHVQSNQLYRARAAQATLHFFSNTDEVNAFATDHRHPEIESPPPLIVLFGGLTRAARMAAIALAAGQSAAGSGKQIMSKAMGTIGRKIIEGGGAFSEEAAQEVHEQFGFAELAAGQSEVARKARSFAAAMYMAVIAHELGHISLGHTLGLQQVSLEISRNQEREADSFAASVASASPFSDYTVAGGIFWWVIMTWAEAAGGSRRETTHPHSRERLMDYLRSNRDQAQALGLTEERVQVLLPEQ